MCRAFLLKLVVVVSSLFLFGFGVPSHTAISNQTLDELEESLNGAEPELVFHDLAVAITQDRRAYDAILAHPEFFRMGAAGPDAFPELVSGQLFHHVNQGVLPEDSESPAVASHRPFEDRTPNTFRSIDVAMRMLNFAVTGPHKDDPRVLAFAMGFVTHSVGDGFMHPRVNELANGYFTLLAGEGAFDEITEEVKHTAIEELLDQVVPSELKNSDPNVDSSDRFDMRAPVAFLDDFYRQGAASDRVGGPIYDWFAIQDDALKAAIVAVDPIRALPSLEDLIREVLLGALDDVTGGALGFGALNAAVEQVMDMLPRDQLVSLASETNLLGFKAEELEKKLIAYRKNMILLSECTMRNLAQASATVEVVDHCASADTLSRIDLNGVVDLTGLFRLELEDLFRGTELEPAPPRSRGFNIRRLIAYAKSSFKLADAIEILIPISISDAITLVRQFVQNNRETINQAFFVVLPSLETLMVAADSAVCTTNCFVNDCVPRLDECIQEASAFCDDVCIQEVGPLDVNLCSLNPCDSLPFPLDLTCDGLTGGFLIPDICESLAYAANCTIEIGQSGIDCTGCTLDCQYDAVTRLELLDVAGMILIQIDAVEDVWEEVKSNLEESILEPAACTAVLDVMREQFTSTRELITMFDFLFDGRTPDVRPDFFAVNVSFLREDFLEDPAYQEAVRDSATTPEQLAALDTVIAGGTLDLFTDPDDDGFNGGCFEFSFVERDFTGQAQALQSLAILHASPGPQASRLLAEYGTNFVRDFVPAENAVAGNKLVPMRDKLDIENMFASQGVAAGLLPWHNALYSDICSDVGDGSVNLLCDVVNSNDDPACFGCAVVADQVPNPSREQLEFDLELVNGIHWRRSLSACASDEEKAELGKPNLTTPFPLASSDDAFEKLFTKIFRCPGAVPGFSSFDDEDDIEGWTSTPNGTLSFDPNRKSTGAGSMRVCGSGFISLASPKFGTAEWNQLSNKLAIDVFAPAVSPLPAWWGALQLQVDVPAANLNNVWVGQIELTGKVTRGAWTTLEFTLPQAVLAALEADFPNARLRFNLNVPPGGDCWGLDNLHFAGDKHFRTVFHRPGSRHLDVRTSDFLSFEVAGDWTATGTTVTQNFDLVEHGAASLAVTGAGYKVVASRPFHTNEIRQVGNQLNLDLFVPDPQPNPYWVGQVSVSFHCPSAGLYNVSVGQRELTHLFHEEFNSLLFTLPANVRSALLGSFAGCRFNLALNVNAGSGVFLFDKLGFVGNIVQK